MDKIHKEDNKVFNITCWLVLAIKKIQIDVRLSKKVRKCESVGF